MYLSKRVFDIILSSIGLIIALPIFICIAFLVKLDSSGSIFFRQERVGYKNRYFNILKFRTMHINKEGTWLTVAGDPRITRIGYYLRKYKLDELPQLFNILIGDMSFVGPRPKVASAIELYTEAEKCLLQVRPGVTDFASLVFADESEVLAKRSNPQSYYTKYVQPWKSEFGLVYLQYSSLSLDIKIIFLTVLNIISRDKALYILTKLFRKLKVDKTLQQVIKNRYRLKTLPPPLASYNHIANKANMG